MIRFSLLGSGSSGNAILVSALGTKVLVDCGLSLKQLTLRAAAVGESLDDLSAVFITHEHGDHVGGLGTLARRLKAPVFLTGATRASLPRGVGDVPGAVEFEAGDTVPVGALEVESFSVSHDAADPVGYVIRCGGVKLGIAADLGHASKLVSMRLAQSHGLVLESNYCPDLLRAGSYPPQVQQRIKGRHGHLSNHDMLTLLGQLLHERLQVVVLVHISEENNAHDLVLDLACRAVRNPAVSVCVARQDRPTPMFEIGA